MALVDAYRDRIAETDLAVYRSQLGLPACTTATALRQGQPDRRHQLPTQERRLGHRDQPRPGHGLSHLPGCHILLVEASSNSFANLGAAVNYAATQNGAAISNSCAARRWGQPPRAYLIFVWTRSKSCPNRAYR